MVIISLTIGLLSATSALASSFVLHEQRNSASARSGLKRRRIEQDALLPMRIGLMHNEHAGLNAERWLMDVSQPDSKNYGRHWTQEEVVNAFQPSPETIRNVTSWLHDHQIYDFTHTDNKLWFAFDIPASKAESMLQTKYFEHKTVHGEFEASCDYYHLPDYLQPHIDYVKPGIQGSVVTGRTTRSRRFVARKRAELSTLESPSLPARSETRDTSIPSYTNATSKKNCWEAVTPACIRYLNQISVADAKSAISANNSMGLFEYYEDFIYQPSLNHFVRNFAPEIPQGTSIITKPIAGTQYPDTKRNYSRNHEDGAEVELDVAVALPIIYPQNITTLTLESGYPLDALDLLLDAIDGSYCSVKQPADTGNGTLQCGIYKPPNVLSVSYTTGEQDNTKAALERQCNEYLKLALQGVSVIFSSGDIGVGVTVMDNGTEGSCKDPGAANVFGPTFPAACPWITSVGATRIPQYGTVEDAEIGAEWYDGKTGQFYGSSSGGFSTAFPPPAYQKSALATYFKDHNPKWPYFTSGDYHNNTGRYNRNGRGFPDISAVGTNVVEFVNEKYTTDNGTSASAPLVAAMFNRIIEECIRAGKGRLGFLNPTLYKNPGIFVDVVKGGNGFCAPDQGFHAVPGWDPVTGLGIPVYPKLLDGFMKLK